MKKLTSNGFITMIVVMLAMIIFIAFFAYQRINEAREQASLDNIKTTLRESGL